MRRLLFLLFLVLAACGGDGQDLRVVPEPTPTIPASHAPQIFNLELSLDSAMYMEGNGKLAATVVIEVEDAGQDIETLMVKMSDLVNLSIDVSGLVNGPRGTITQEFDIATTEVGRFQILIWLVDSAGDSTGQHPISFIVRGDPFTWLERAAALPNALNAVIAEPYSLGFIAVGDAGTILASEDGITWVEQDSGTDVDLHDIFCDHILGLGGYCYAVGDAGTVLRSVGPSDWSIFHEGPEDLSLQAIVVARFFDQFPFDRQILAVGTMVTTDTACILQTNDNGDQWSEIEPTGQSGQHITDVTSLLVGENSTYHVVATLEVPFSEQGRILVSADGLTWVEVFISDGHESTYSLQQYHDGVWAGGNTGNMYATADGVNWTRYETPAVQSKLVAMSSGDSYSMLMAHGYSESVGLKEQFGVATSDGGETWKEFVIGTAYEPRGLAYIDGRWVSVGQSLAEPGKGAIFTTQ